ncbi:uncharacterized protein LOC120347487 [Styela clava]|uniref:uncharacterized protein LOC120347487 n=1 Tax=Styela clava TaxID=7725 RepID=UPI0019392929|nr:uncharacterized protein LOC120347487 [Styela clava]
MRTIEHPTLVMLILLSSTEARYLGPRDPMESDSFRNQGEDSISIWILFVAAFVFVVILSVFLILLTLYLTRKNCCCEPDLSKLEFPERGLTQDHSTESFAFRSSIRTSRAERIFHEDYCDDSEIVNLHTVT